MSFDFKETAFKDLIIIKPHIFNDERGSYIKFFSSDTFETNGLPTIFTESSEIIAKKGSLRGLHFQLKNPQGKLIRLIKGLIFDVAVDIREDSKTFGAAYCCLLSDCSNECIYIPSGFAHGFLALEDSVFLYESTGLYDPLSSGTIKWSDDVLDIRWPINGLQLIISEKDQNGMSFQSFKQLIKEKNK